MFVLPEVGDEFIYKVGEVYYLMLQEGEYIDQDIKVNYCNYCIIHIIWFLHKIIYLLLMID